MKRNEYLHMHREKPYMQLISMFYDFQSQTKTGKEFTQEELINLFNQFTKELTLWGSSKAIYLPVRVRGLCLQVSATCIFN